MPLLLLKMKIQLQGNKNWRSATFCISFFPWLCNVEKWFNSGLSGRVSKLQKTFRVTLNDHQRMMGLPQKMPKFEPISEKIDLNYSIQITFTYATKLCTRIMNILREVKIEIRKWVLWILLLNMCWGENCKQIQQ